LFGQPPLKIAPALKNIKGGKSEELISYPRCRYPSPPEVVRFVDILCGQVKK